MTEICFVKRAFLILSIFLWQSQVFGGSVPSISVHCGNEKLTWHQASYYCEVRGQHLAIPRSFAELVHIRDFCKKQVWIGPTYTTTCMEAHSYSLMERMFRNLCGTNFNLTTTTTGANTVRHSTHTNYTTTIVKKGFTQPASQYGINPGGEISITLLNHAGFLAECLRYSLQ